MQFFKRDSHKAEKKHRNSKADIHQVVAAESSPASMVAPNPVDQPSTMLPGAPDEPMTDMPSAMPMSDTPTNDMPTATKDMPSDNVDMPTEMTDRPSTDASTRMAPMSAEAVTTMIPMQQTVPTSVVMQTKTTPSSEKEQEMKMEAAVSYTYGVKEDRYDLPDKKTSSASSDARIRTNRAQELRQSSNLKRINEDKMMREQLMRERIIRARSEMGDSSEESEDEEGEPIQARLIPRSLYHKPKIMVRETVSSKFRYLFNRRPHGVTVYFKQADDQDPKRKPPFVVANVHHCY